MLRSAVNGSDAATSGAAARSSSAPKATPATPPKKAQDQALGEQLRDQTAAAGSQSGSQRHLLPPGCSFGQRQVRHVRAGDQQHHQHRSKRQVDRAAQGISNQHLRERIHREAPVLLVNDSIETGSQHGHLGSRLLDAHAGAQTPNGVQPMLTAIHLIRCEDQRLPEHRLVAIETARGQNPDDPVRFTVEHQIAFQNAGIARELRLPERVAQHHHRRRSRLIFSPVRRSARFEASRRTLENNRPTPASPKRARDSRPSPPRLW